MIPGQRQGRVHASGLRRGRVLGIGHDGDGRVRGIGIWTAQPAGSDEPAWIRNAGLVLLAVLPLFGQLAHYLIDLGPLYYLSKAWPFLTLPLAFYAILALRTPIHVLYLLTLAYAIGVTPALSIAWLGNNFVDALGTTIKMWPLSYYFSVLACLALLRVPRAVVTKAVLRLGTATFAAMWVLWIVVPASFYASDATLSKLFMYEVERGYRIYMPMAFGLVALFYLAYRMAETPRLWMALAMAGGLISMVLIFKQRTAIAAAVLVMLLIFAGRLPLLARTFFIMAGIVGGLTVAILVVANLDRIAESLGASLTIRQNSVALATDYLLNSPLRWLFGVGATTRFGSVTLAQIFGSEHFYLADIGWLGVLFEYGLVGTTLIALLYFAALRLPIARQGDAADLAMAHALKAYILFLLITTAIYSAVYAPGELATMTALLLYMSRQQPPDRAA